MATRSPRHRTAIGWAWVGGQVVALGALVLLPWRLHGPLAVALGVVLVLAAAWFAVAAFRSLGSALTPTPVPISGAGLRTSGVYAWVRHPIYSAILLAVLGLLVAAGTPMSWLWLLVLAGFFWAKSRWEDALLHAEYGTDWEQWARRTGGLLPRRVR